MTNWIKNHALSMTSSLNRRLNFTSETLIEQLQRLFGDVRGVTADQIKNEVMRLIATGQICTDEDGFVRNGVPIFEEGVMVTASAAAAAADIVKDLKGRRGIGNEIEACSDDVLQELENTIASIIDKHRS